MSSRRLFFDGRYNTLDGDMATIMLLRDNHTLANELDLVRDHDLIKRVHQYGIMSPMNPLKNNEDYAQYYTWEGNTTVQLDGWAWWTMGMVLRPHEAIEWRWGHETPVKYHGDMAGHPPMAPDTIYNGVWEYAPDFKNDSQWRAGATVTNITNKDGVLTAADGGTGTIVWQMKVPYQFVGGTLAAAGDGYAFEIGFPDPKDWRRPFTRRWRRWPSLTASSKAARPTGNEYWLKCTLTGKASLTRRQNQERHPDGAAGHAVHDRGRQPFHVRGAHGRQKRRKRRQASEDHAHLGRTVEDTPSESARISRAIRPTAARATARMWCSSGTPPRTPTATPSRIIISSFRTVPTCDGPCLPISTSTFPRRPTKARPATRFRVPAS